MQRRAALTAAGTASLAAVALSVGIAVNLGILNSGTTGAGDLTLAAEQAPTSTPITKPATTPATTAAPETTTAIPPEPRTEYVTYYQDIPAPAAPAPEAPAATSPTPADEPPDESGSDGTDGSDGGGGSGTNGGDDDEDTDRPPGNGSPPSTTPATTTPTTPATSPPTTAVPPSAVSYSAAGAGTITAEVSRYTMTIVSTSPSNGWTASVTRSSGQEVSVRFTGPDGTLYWKAHVEDGGVEVEMESDNEGDD